MSVAVIAGGVGAARLLAGLVRVVPPEVVTAVVNVGDDTTLFGLHISPDLDTITYTLAGAVHPETGWGLADETWHAMEALARYGGPTWFRLGDRDLATHLYRTDRLAEGVPLSQVTAEIAAAWGLALHLVPATDDPLATRLTIVDGGPPVEVGFQDYFVARRHDVPVVSVRFAGAEHARPAPGICQAIQAAGRVVVAPSNPVVSIAPVLAVDAIRAALTARRADTVAVSPIVAGAALKGPAARLMAELGHEASVVGVARLYAPLAATLVIDEADEHLADQVEEAGMRAVVAPTVMSDPDRAAALARTVLA